MKYVVYSMSGMFSRYLRKRLARLAYYARRPLSYAEIVSACLVFGETFRIYSEVCARAGSYVHPIAASATLIALVAHLPEL